MYCFVDETGNTGANLFDEIQPDYYTAALITRSNFDLVYKSAIKKLAQSLGRESLHANEIGFEGLQKIAPSITKILKNSDGRVFISRVEKKYLLCTKIVDHLFDAGENPTIPWHYYNIRPLRLMMVFKVSLILQKTDAEKFWQCLMERNEKKCRDLLQEFCSEVLPNVERIPDSRSREIIGGAIGWIIDHPEAPLLHTKGKNAAQGHMPNMVAFSNLMDGIDRYATKLGKQVKKITHDQQEQFQKTLVAWHGMYTNASPEPLQLPGETHVLQKVPNSEFELKNDENSPGIQVIDIILWLYRQYLSGKDFPVECAQLLNQATKRARINDFSFEGVDHSLHDKYKDMLSVELSPEKELEARAMIQAQEERRKENTMLYEQDGLRPFERQ